MELDIQFLKDKFYEIKSKGWHRSVREGSSGVGVTFEKLLGLDENTLEIPDLINLEIKTKRDNSRSHVTLFSCAPEGPHYHEVERLKNIMDIQIVFYHNIRF